MSLEQRKIQNGEQMKIYRISLIFAFLLTTACASSGMNDGLIPMTPIPSVQEMYPFAPSQPAAVTPLPNQDMYPFVFSTPPNTSIPTAILAEPTSTATLPFSSPGLKYYWFPSSAATNFKIASCLSYADDRGYRLTIEGDKSATIAGGRGVGWLPYLPPCTDDTRLVTVRGQAGCVYDPGAISVRLFWQEGEDIYVVNGNNGEQQAIALANSLEAIGQDEFKQRLQPLVTPTVVPYGPLVYFWPVKIPDGWHIESNGSRADETGYVLRIMGANAQEVRLSGGSVTEMNEYCNERLQPAVIRGQQGYLDTGTGAGFALLWRENGQPYSIGGMSVGIEFLKDMAQGLVSLDLAAWNKHLVQIP